jgi:DNA-binding transcriptional MerR regulator
MSKRIKDNLLTIGQVAEAVNLTADTIRFYEKKALIDKPPRTKSGYRQYSTDVIRKLLFIKHAQECGLALNNIKDLLNLQEAKNADCVDIKAIVQEKLTKLRRKIDELEYFYKTLGELDKICSGNGSISDCPMLDTLNNAEMKDNDLDREDLRHRLSIYFEQ